MNISILFSALWKFLRPIFSSLARQVSAEAIEMVMQYVIIAASGQMTNAERRDWVAAQMREWSLSTGTALGDSLINFLIEMAVQKLAAKKRG